MNRKLRWLLILVILAAFGVWLEPTRVAWGWLHGEAFYDGRPTSWWERELMHWEALLLEGQFTDWNEAADTLPARRTILYYGRTKNDGFAWLRRLFGRETPTKINLNEMLGVDGRLQLQGPALVLGDENAEPVLRALADNPVEHIRRIAHHGLQRIETMRRLKETP